MDTHPVQDVKKTVRICELNREGLQGLRGDLFFGIKERKINKEPGAPGTGHYHTEDRKIHQFFSQEAVDTKPGSQEQHAGNDRLNHSTHSHLFFSTVAPHGCHRSTADASKSSPATYLSEHHPRKNHIGLNLNRLQRIAPINAKADWRFHLAY